MTANSMGNFGTYKLDFLNHSKTIPSELPIDVTNVTHGVNKDVDYFQKNLSRTNSNQVVNYTWEKSNEESPSFYKEPAPIVYDKEDLTKKMPKNTLELMSMTKGHLHGYKHNEWETESNKPPVLLAQKAKRYGINLSAMSQYAEEVNRTYPGHSLY